MDVFIGGKMTHKKILEGASVVSAIFLVLTCLSAFIFNVRSQSSKRKAADKKEKKWEKKHHSQICDLEKELEYYKKKNDPLWHYYDENGNLHLKPGTYKKTPHSSNL